MNKKIFLAVLFGIACPMLAFGLDELNVVAARMDGVEGLELKGDPKIESSGPNGEKVLHFTGGFSGRIDLAKLNIDPHSFDLIKIEIKADPLASMTFGLENFPETDFIPHWYIWTGETKSTWRTLWLDIHIPEDLKAAGGYKGFPKDPSLHGLQFAGKFDNLNRSIQPPEENIWVGKIRFVKKSVDLDWDQRLAPYTWEKGNDLVFKFPLTVKNVLGKPLTANLKLVPQNVTHAHAKLSEGKVPLAPGETKTVTAEISLPNAVALEKGPLYSEGFEAQASAEGIEDSTVTILRSSDVVPLTVTVPIPEEKLKFPLAGDRKGLPESITGAEKLGAEKTFQEIDPKDLDTVMAHGGFGRDKEFLPLKILLKSDKGVLDGYNLKGKSDDDGERFKRGTIACAYLYSKTGDVKYLDKEKTLLLNLAATWQKYEKEFKERKFKQISEGIICGGVLDIGFDMSGSMDPPYLLTREGPLNAFDLVSAGLDAPTRQKLIEDWVLPMGIQCRNHHIGPSNQQSTFNYQTLYAGLATRNWPLVTFAYSTDYGILGQLKWGFNDDGLAQEGHYQTYHLSPNLKAAELLYRAGIDVYDQRLYEIVHSKGAISTGMSYLHPNYVAFADQNRFAGKDFMKNVGNTTDGYQLSASTLLSWKGLQVMMNWKVPVSRGNSDRCALSVRVPKGESRKIAVGGCVYSHSSFGQSVIIINENQETCKGGRPVAFDVDGPVQFITVVDDEDYPGTKITRTYALLEKHVLVVDRVESPNPVTADWCLLGAGSTISIPTQTINGSFTQKPNNTEHHVSYGADIKSYKLAKTNNTWQEGDGRLTMLGSPDTEIMTLDLSNTQEAEDRVKEREDRAKDKEGQDKGKGKENPKGKKANGTPYLMVRHKNVKQSDYAAFISLDTKSVEQVPVKKSDGTSANAIGVRMTLMDGKSFQAIVNYEPEGTEVVLGGLKTKDRFATDYK